MLGKLDTNHYSRHFIFIHLILTTSKVLLLSAFYNYNTKRLNNLPKATQLESGRDGIYTLYSIVLEYLFLTGMSF